MANRHECPSDRANRRDLARKSEKSGTYAWCHSYFAHDAALYLILQITRLPLFEVTRHVAMFPFFLKPCLLFL